MIHHFSSVLHRVWVVEYLLHQLMVQLPGKDNNKTTHGHNNDDILHICLYAYDNMCTCWPATNALLPLWVKDTPPVLCGGGKVAKEKLHKQDTILKSILNALYLCIYLQIGEAHLPACCTHPLLLWTTCNHDIKNYWKNVIKYQICIWNKYERLKLASASTVETRIASV